MSKSVKESLDLKVVSDHFSFGLDRERVARWLPFTTDSATIDDFVANLTLYRQSLPVTEKDLFFYQAFVREYLRNQPNPINLNQNEIVKVDLQAEILNLSLNDNHSLMIFLDSFRPDNIVDVYSSEERIAMCICPVGQVDATRIDSKIQILLDLGFSSPQEIILAPNDITFVPTEQNQAVNLILNCPDNWTIFGKSKLSLEVIGGRFGLVFDMRGRPFDGPSVSNEGRKQLILWLKSLGISTEFVNLK